MERIILPSVWNFPGLVVQTAFLVSRRTSWGKKFLGKKYAFFHRFFTLRENCSTFRQSFFDKVVDKGHSPCPQKHLGKNIFLRIKSFFVILTKWAKLFLSKFNCGFLKSEFYASVGNFWSKWPLFTKIFTILWHGAKSCLLFVETFPTGLTKLYCRWPEEKFQNRKFFLKVLWFFHILGTLIKLWPAFWHFFSGKFVKTAIYMSKETVQRKKLFKIGYNQYIIFRQGAKKLWLSDKFFLIGWSKLQAACL